MSEREPLSAVAALDLVAEALPSSEPPCPPRQRVRARTISIKRLSKREMERERRLTPEVDVERPETRQECEAGQRAGRPCPFVSCKHHLYLDVNERTGSIKLNFPDLEVWELSESCALDIADRGGTTLEETGEILNLTRERIRQIETRSFAKLRASANGRVLLDLLDLEEGAVERDRGGSR